MSVWGCRAEHVAPQHTTCVLTLDGPSVTVASNRVLSLHRPKVTLDLQNSSEKFGGFLRSALDVLAQILELATLQDIGKVCASFLLGAVAGTPDRTLWARCLRRWDPLLQAHSESTDSFGRSCCDPLPHATTHCLRHGT